MLKEVSYAHATRSTTIRVSLIFLMGLNCGFIV